MALTKFFTRRVGLRFALWTVALVSACDAKRSDPPLGEERFEPPRLARPLEVARGPLHRYALGEESHIGFRLPAREAKPSGKLGPVEGELQVDVHDLTRLYGKFDVDLSRLALDDDVDGSRATWARAWLGLGQSVPFPEREKNRRASFSIRRAENATARSAWSGRAGPSAAAPDAAGTTASNPARAPQTRIVALDVLGDLSLHGYRVPHRIRCELRFHYDVAPTPEAMPTAMDVATVGRFVVALDEHQIQPRDESGQLVANELPLLGRIVGKEMHLDVHLSTRLTR